MRNLCPQKCHFPAVGKSLKQHNESYHSQTRTELVGTTGRYQEFKRNEQGQYECFCSEDHSRYDLMTFRKVLRLNPHPTILPPELGEPYAYLEVDPETGDFVHGEEKRKELLARENARKKGRGKSGKRKRDGIEMEGFKGLEQPGKSGKRKRDDLEIEVEGLEGLLQPSRVEGEGMDIDKDGDENEGGGNNFTEEVGSPMELGKELGEEEAGENLNDSEGFESEEEEGNEDNWINHLEQLGEEKAVPQHIVDKLLVENQSSVDPADATKILQRIHVVVDPTWKWSICVSCRIIIHWTSVYKHASQAHLSKTSRITAFTLDASKAPTESEVTQSLITLGAPENLPFPDHAIDPVPGLNVENAVKCGVDGCNYIRKSKNSLHNHYAEMHPELPSQRRTFPIISVHPLTAFRGRKQFLEIISLPIPPLGGNSIAIEILSYAKSKQLGVPSYTYLSPLNPADLNPVFAQFHWNQLIERVFIPSLRLSAKPPDSEDEPVYYRILTCSRTYYEGIMKSLDSIDITTRKWLCTGSINTPLKSVPFRRPQELGTVLRDADFVSTFVIFLHRHAANPLANFPIVLHENPRTILARLYDTAADTTCTESEIESLFHSFIWSYLSHPDETFLRDDLMDPLTRFLLAYHIKDDYGQFADVKSIPPSISRAQWALRATGAWEVKQISKNYNNIQFDAYQAVVHQWLTDARKSTFSKLRDSMKQFSALAFAQPSKSKFTWDATGEVITIDGHPLSAKRLFTSWKEQVGALMELMEKLFVGCEFGDILDYIDSRTNPDPEQISTWFRDAPSNTDISYSIFTEKSNNLEQFRRRLFNHLCNHPSFFNKVDDCIHPNEGKIGEWFGQLQDVVNCMWYLIHATAPGGSRGREMEPLMYANHYHHPKNLHFISGHCGLESVYGKMDSQRGYSGESLFRIIPSSIARLVMVVLCCAYYAAANIGFYLGMPKEDAENYLCYVFVRYGKPMLSSHFSSVLRNITESTIGFPLHLLQFRHLKSNLMVHKAKIDWDEPDEEEEEDRAARGMMGHTPGMGMSTYGKDDRGTRVKSADAVQANIRSGIKWQGVIDFLHPLYKKKVYDRQREYGVQGSLSADILEIILNEKFGKVEQFTRGFILESEKRIIDSMKTISSSTSRQTAEIIIGYMSGSSSVPQFPSPPIIVTPRLLQTVQCSLPDVKRWKSPQQAESVASVLGDSHVFSILATGEGKSLQFFAAPILKPGRLFVVILPLVSLTIDMTRRLELMPYHGGIWGPDLDTVKASLVLVPAHLAGTSAFKKWLLLPEVNNRLDRIFVDEAHHIKTDRNFRECFQALCDHILVARKPISFLSGSLGPHDMTFITKACGMNEPSLVTEIRSYCGRPNHRYTHEQVDAKDMLHGIKKFIDQVGELSSDQRGLIFVDTIENCKKVAAHFGFEAYYAAESDEQKKKFQQLWRAGPTPKDRWMVCTMAFGEGIDSDLVVYVISYNPWGMTSLKQQFGRGGRNGQLSFGHLIWTQLPDISGFKCPDDDLVGRLALHRLLTSPGECMRLSEASYDRVVHSCAALGAELCQNCLKTQDSLEGPALGRLDRPLIPKEIIKIDPDIEMVSVESTTEEHSKGVAECEAQMKLLEKILDRVVESKCQACWVARRLHLNQNHPRNSQFETVSRFLSTAQMPKSLHWAFCFACWVPYRHFNNHIPPNQDAPLISSDCKYNKEMPAMIPNLIAHIWEHTDKVKGIATKLGERCWEDRFELESWLTEPCNSPIIIPNPFRFVIAFYELYVQ
ncbi:hypothetical protein D9758_016336 [Tetrapyrgos nigripes]|uniref:DNA 3'-5' helicase n=1 Tax=Tetrapyrgos nigripes TaxID=182062 RepID=A0A8H5BXN7_9AGAR|nr:hypothetical protein D9758_016336 [Tetrapyrgos nigripes]